MEFLLDATGLLSGAALVWWINAGVAQEKKATGK